MLESVRDLCRFRVRALDGKVGKAADFYFRRFDVVDPLSGAQHDRVAFRPSRAHSS